MHSVLNTHGHPPCPGNGPSPLCEEWREQEELLRSYLQLQHTVVTSALTPVLLATSPNHLRSMLQVAVD